jgi:long-chain-alcohol oxidase
LARYVRRGVEAGAEALEPLGAQRVFSSHAKYIGYEPGRNGDRRGFMSEVDAAGWGQGRVQLTGFHLLSSCRIGSSPKTSVCGAEGATWEVPNLVVCDGSAFPSASGVNPNMSIQSLGYLNAQRLAGHLS